MFVIRAVVASDLPDLLSVSEHLDSVNLPSDESALASIIDRSEKSFALTSDGPKGDFTFVLEERGPQGNRVVGCSMIFANHGTRRAPHVYFDVIHEERYSDSVDKLVNHQLLRIGYNYNGVTEIGGLAILPEFRRHPGRLGKLLSFVRFVYIATHRNQFKDEILAELMPPLESDGRSLLWESLGARFTDMTYQEADRLSRGNKEFIKALFPQQSIYVCLLAPEAQAMIGRVGPSTRPVHRMLTQIGFSHANRIDPFDGGPHFTAAADKIWPVTQTRTLTLLDAPDPKAEDKFCLVAHFVEGPPHLHACWAQAAVAPTGVFVPPEIQAALHAAPGASLALLPLP